MDTSASLLGSGDPSLGVNTTLTMDPSLLAGSGTSFSTYDPTAYDGSLSLGVNTSVAPTNWASYSPSAPAGSTSGSWLSPGVLQSGTSLIQQLIASGNKASGGTVNSILGTVGYAPTLQQQPAPATGMAAMMPMMILAGLALVAMK